MSNKCQHVFTRGTKKYSFCERPSSGKYCSIHLNRKEKEPCEGTIFDLNGNYSLSLIVYTVLHVAKTVSEYSGEKIIQ